MDNATLWLIRLVAAHLLTDFVFQPDKWVNEKKIKKHRTPHFWYHIALTTIIAYWFTCFDTWWVAPVIFISHGLIDWWKCHQKDSTTNFVIDQVAHLIVIAIVWHFRFPDAIPFGQICQSCLLNKNVWIVSTTIIFLSSPVGIVIGMFTKKYSDQIEEHKEKSLADAGQWIGMLERLIVLFLVIIGKYEAIGLLVAAKSIIRLKDGDQKMGEYVLIGTLTSISVALITGFIVSKTIN